MDDLSWSTFEGWSERMLELWPDLQQWQLKFMWNEMQLAALELYEATRTYPCCDHCELWCSGGHVVSCPYTLDTIPDDEVD